MKFGNRHASTLGLVAIALIIFALCVQHQRWKYADWHQGSGKYIQRIHLPDKKVIQIAALGYDNLYADFLTLRAIQMFGAAWDTESGDVKPIYDYFDILTSLDPHFIDVYELAHLVISDDHQAHELAQDLLRKGYEKNPTEWRIPYLGLYTAAWSQKNPDVAREFLRYLQGIPDVPEHILRMEEYIERQSGAYHAAYDVNLRNYINYRQLKMEAEESLALEKFRVIFDGWYKLELARVADAFHQKHGRHPESIEELLGGEEFIPRFEAPTLESLLFVINLYADQPGGLEAHRDEIRERAKIQIVGLPPEPMGSWYYIDPGVRSLTIQKEEEAAGTEARKQQNGEKQSAQLIEQYPYFYPANDVFVGLDMLAGQAQREIMAAFSETGEYPTPEEISQYMLPDNFGGHFVYIRDNTPDGYPRFFSTTQIRRALGKDPRMGMRGLLQNFPQRTYRISDNLPPYLTTLPTEWDFPEDAEWAICMGLEPGIRMSQQAPEAVEAINDVTKYHSCNTHIGIPMELEK